MTSRETKQNQKRIRNAIVVSVLRRLTALCLALALFAGISPFLAEAKGKTGVGMAEWAFRAYNEGWVYTYGGSKAGRVDCSGLIRSYSGLGGGAKALLDASSVNGSTSDMPRIHGLGLWCSGHAGVYVGKNKDGVDMAIDMRNSRVNVVYSAMNSRYYSPWKKWFKIKGLTYPTTGWVEFRGSRYYYKNGEFVVGKVKIDGKTYDFGKSGALKGEAADDTPAETQKKTTIKKTTQKTTTTTTEAPPTTMEEPVAVTEQDPPATTEQVTTTTRETTEATTERTTQKTTTEKTTKKTTIEKTTKKTTTEKTTKKTTAEKTTKKTTAEKTTKKTTAEKTTKKTTTEKTPKKTTAEKTTQKTTKKRTTTRRPTTTRTTGYQSYEGGMQGDVVTRMQTRLTELGYYDQDITGYYGPFTRDAIKSFQKALGVLPTGIADEATQKALFAADAPAYSEEHSIVQDKDYQMDEEEEETDDPAASAEGSADEAPAVIAPSEGIGALGMSGDPYRFTQLYGESGPLQTMGVFSYQSPSVVFYRNGESYEVTEDMMKTLENCVFM